MELKIKLDDKNIQEQVEEAINSKVAGIVWSMRSVVVEKLVAKYMPSELDEFKKESSKAFREAIREAVKGAVKDYPSMMNSSKNDVYDEALMQLKSISTQLKQAKPR